MNWLFTISTALALSIIFSVASCAPPVADKSQFPDFKPAANVPVPQPASTKTTPKPAPRDEETQTATIKPLTVDQQAKLLNERLDGGMGSSFGRFANMFLVSSRLRFGTGVGLMTSSRDISNLPLQSPFPESYKPTLREFLDAIALQTFSEWKYDPSSKFFQSDVPDEKVVERLAIFEFKKAMRDKPFEITMAKGWRSEDKGNWVMLSPPSFPVRLDVYEMGTYSPEEKTAEKEFSEKIRAAIALEWASQVNKEAKTGDLVAVKVGPFDALYYESMIPSQLDKEIKWRQWVVMVDNKCYFLVSTILPEFEDKVFPDVEKMVASFRLKAKQVPTKP